VHRARIPMAPCSWVETPSKQSQARPRRISARENFRIIQKRSNISALGQRRLPK